jgi:hypothetical protein
VWVAPGQKPPPIPRGFHVLPRRWVVERTLAWIGRNRRMAKDYEHLTSTGEMLVYMAMSRVMLRRAAKTATLKLPNRPRQTPASSLMIRAQGRVVMEVMRVGL